jgi:hypothetical protein
MKAYIKTTGAVFGLLTVAHAWRIFVEGLHVARDPWFLVTTVAAVALCVWAWRLLRVSQQLARGPWRA